MRLVDYRWVGIVLTLAMIFCAAIKAGAADGIKKIEESELDAKIGENKNPLAMVFMAAWCSPCIDELPMLNKLHKKYKDQGLEIIGISIDLEGPDAMQPIISDLKIDFPIFWYGEKAIEKFTLFAIPMIFLAKQGEIVERIHGRRSESYLDKKFRDLLQ